MTCKFFFCRAGIWLVFLFGTVAFAARGFEKIMYIGIDSYDRSQIFCVNPDGSNIVRLTSVKSGIGITQFAVNPQGSKIAYLVYDNNVSILYSMDSNGDNVRRVTQTGVGSDSNPVFDLNGKTIYVQKSNKQIDSADISGLKRTKFKDKFGYTQIMSINKTDGDIIAVNGDDVCSISKDGIIKNLNISGARKITSSNHCFVYDKFDKTFNIFTSNIDGNNKKQLTDDGNCNYDPAISPDGTQVAFCGYDVKKINPGLEGIFIVNIDGTGYHELIRTNRRAVNTIWTILDKEPKVLYDEPDWPNYWEKVIHPPQPDLMISTMTDAYRGKGIFDSEGKQKLTTSIGSRRIVTYYIRLINNGTSQESFKLTATGGQTGWKCSYFQNTKNISNSLNNYFGLITPSIAAGESYDFRVEVTPASNVKTDDIITVNINVSSLLDPQICDMVTAVTTKSGK